MSAQQEEPCPLAKRVANEVLSALPDMTDVRMWDEIYGVRVGDQIEVRLTGDVYRGGYAGFSVPLARDASDEEYQAAVQNIFDQILEMFNEDGL